MFDDIHWMADQVVYEIVPDRFAIGDPFTTETKFLSPKYSCQYDATTHHGEKENLYELRKWDEDPVKPSMGWDFFGGDLNGIADRLDYLQDLGITTIFLTPIFWSPSNHKYHALDFFLVDEQFGGEEALRRLIIELQRRGLRLILDAVFNHVSDQHQWFRDAKENKEPYKGFFTRGPEGKYLSWRNHWEMPELNIANPAVQDILFRNRNSVLHSYLNMGISGWRFDAATDLGVDVAMAIRDAISARFPGAALIGEATNYGAALVSKGAYDGVMNYYFSSAVGSWLQGEISARQMNRAVGDYFRGYGLSGSLCSWNILSSHDTARLKNNLPEDWRRKLAIIAQFTFPGVPFVYYGEEIGMVGAGDPDCRRTMIWDEARWDKDSLEFYKRLIAIRQTRRELRRGTFVSLDDSLHSNAVAFLRYTDHPQEVALVVLNNSLEAVNDRVFIPYSHLYDGLRMVNLLAPNEPYLTMGRGYVDLTVPPKAAVILVPKDDEYSHYRFFKNR